MTPRGAEIAPEVPWDQLCPWPKSLSDLDKWPVCAQMAGSVQGQGRPGPEGAAPSDRSPRHLSAGPPGWLLNHTLPGAVWVRIGETGSQAVWAGPRAYACSRKSKPHFLSWSFSKCFKAGSFGQMPFAPRGSAFPKMPAGKSVGSRVTESGQRRLGRWGRLGAMAPLALLSPSLSGRPLLTSSKAPGFRLQDTGSP